MAQRGHPGDGVVLRPVADVPPARKRALGALRRYLVVPGAEPMHGELAVDDVVLAADDEALVEPLHALVADHEEEEEEDA